MQRVKVDGGTSTNLDPVHDAAGNLVLDAEYFYQYDAWNRLIKVSNRGTLQMSLGTGQGGGLLAVSGTPGAWIVHYTYDGLGRLIRKQSPWPTPDPYGRPQVRTEHFYYDGVRRVQEVVTDPIALDGESEPITVEDEAELPPLATVSLTRREYVHSPGYVDEVVAQVDVSAAAGASHGADRPAWVIQDANYNLVGLVGDDGTLLHQYTWDPYGEPVAIERYDTGAGGAPQPFENRIGHQGLFFDRFDGGANNVLLPQLWVDAGTGLAAKGLYQNRNRSYSPGLGRFVQRDPNATALMIHNLAFTHGQLGGARVATADLMTTYQDGLGIYQYVRSKPHAWNDPMGTSGFMTPEAVWLEMQLTATRVAVAGLNFVRGQMASILAKLYSSMMVGVEIGVGVAAGEAAGPGSVFGVGGVNASVAMIRSVESLGGRTGQLLELAGENFRSNLSTLTRFSGRFQGTLYHAHHIIPQELRALFAQIGVNIDNPIFGQWVAADDHLALHAGKVYNNQWKAFYDSLQELGVTGDEAYRRVARFITENAESWGFQVPLPR